MSEVKIIDNIPPDYHKALVDTVMGGSLQWYFLNKTVNLDDSEGVYGSFLDDKTKDSQQFVHVFIDDNKSNSAHSNLVGHMFNFFGGVVIKDVYRVKANLMLRESDYPNDFHHIAHGDIVNERKYKSFVYYLNDSDGDTFMYKERVKEGWKDDLKDITLIERYTPKANTGIYFDSQQIHASSPPRINNYRVVLNYVFEIE
jgi:hypothetical protein